MLEKTGAASLIWGLFQGSSKGYLIAAVTLLVSFLMANKE